MRHEKDPKYDPYTGKRSIETAFEDDQTLDLLEKYFKLGILNNFQRAKRSCV